MARIKKKCEKCLKSYNNIHIYKGKEVCYNCHKKLTEKNNFKCEECQKPIVDYNKLGVCPKCRNKYKYRKPS